MTKRKVAKTINEQKQVIEEKSKKNELLIKEVHHRVKNNLQIILSLLSTQTHRIEDDPQTLDIIRESQNKIKSMALIHEKLYQTERIATIRTTSYFQNLIDHIESSYRDIHNRINIETNIEEDEITMALAVPLGLIVNELISNSYKYTGDQQDETRIVTINFKKKPDENIYKLEVFDNRMHFYKDFEMDKSSTFGLQIIRELVDQLRGKIEYRQDEDIAGFDISIEYDRAA